MTAHGTRLTAYGKETINYLRHSVRRMPCAVRLF